MKVVRISDLEGTDRDVRCPDGGFRSLRALLRDDGMGFSLHKTIVPAGTGPQHWHYRHHLEACFCVAGKGLLTNLATGEYFAIAPDTVYVLDAHDPHTFEALEDTVLVSVFNPPLTGQELHGPDRSYADSSEVA